ncbi:hypothetical protein [Actinomadura macra]|uniref:hypothetical protein n=1 Tax=Actinomadura macra TaxID=46164 RepID=UPI0012F97EEF|nr:hypothetical protein [Actinomadura macra]
MPDVSVAMLAAAAEHEVGRTPLSRTPSVWECLKGQRLPPEISCGLRMFADRGNDSDSGVSLALSPQPFATVPQRSGSGETVRGVVEAFGSIAFWLRHAAIQTPQAHLHADLELKCRTSTGTSVSGRLSGGVDAVDSRSLGPPAAPYPILRASFPT